MEWANAEPVAAAGYADFNCQFVFVCAPGPAECGAGIVIVVAEALDVPSARRAGITQSGDADHRGGLVAVPLGMAAVHLAAVRAELEFLQRILIDRGEHPVAHPTAGIAAAQQTFVEQRLHGVNIGARDCLCGLVRATIAEDGQRGKQMPLAICE